MNVYLGQTVYAVYRIDEAPPTVIKCEVVGVGIDQCRLVSSALSRAESVSQSKVYDTFETAWARLLAIKG
jgi:hypothetical protein